jgi:hypothetical protein
VALVRHRADGEALRLAPRSDQALNQYPPDFTCALLTALKGDPADKSNPLHRHIHALQLVKDLQGRAQALLDTLHSDGVTRLLKAFYVGDSNAADEHDAGGWSLCECMYVHNTHAAAHDICNALIDAFLFSCYRQAADEQKSQDEEEEEIVVAEEEEEKGLAGMDVDGEEEEEVPSKTEPTPSRRAKRAKPTPPPAEAAAKSAPAAVTGSVSSHHISHARMDV